MLNAATLTPAAQLDMDLFLSESMFYDVKVNRLSILAYSGHTLSGRSCIGNSFQWRAEEEKHRDVIGEYTRDRGEYETRDSSISRD